VTDVALLSGTVQAFSMAHNDVVMQHVTPKRISNSLLGAQMMKKEIERVQLSPSHPPKPRPF
jgi:hypothetical protein